jgi:histidyl-tRNA synthetase
MASNEKTLKARSPRGFADRSAADIRATEKMVATIRGVYERYGFDPLETPLVEYTEALGKFLPDQERPNEGVFSFRDEGDGDTSEWLSLRYDLTAPLARYVAENYDKLPKPYRSYRVGWVFRNEKPGPGRFRQFLQFDADTVGAASPAADAEMCMMMADVMEALGIQRGQYVIKVNSRKMLDGVMEAIGVSDERQKLTILRAIDKLDRLGIEGVKLLLGPGRWDGGSEGKGDFTKGAGLADAQIDRLSRFFSAASVGAGGLGLFEWWNKVAPEQAVDSVGADGVRSLHELLGFLPADYAERIKFDTSVVRGLEYYTGAVFEAELLAEIPNEKGQPVVFGSVGGGGRYDGLVGRFMKDSVPATGFSIGVSRLQVALSALGKLDAKAGSGPVIVLVMDKARVGDYQKMVAALRAADIAAELYLGDSGMKAQMKYADKRDAPLAIIQGGDEKAKGVVQIKDMRAGKELAAGMSDHDAYREARPGQEEVAEGELVAAVKRLLRRAS